MSETNSIAASGTIYPNAGAAEIPLSKLFQTYNVTDTVASFDAQIHTHDGSYIYWPDGPQYGYGTNYLYGQLTPDIPIGQLSLTYFVPSGSAGESSVIAFNSDTSAESYSFPAVSVVLGTGMEKGIDYPDALDATQAAAIASAGYKFVIRYYSSNGSEISLTKAELGVLESANLQVCTVWENRSEQSGVNAFSDGAGDATSAITQALAARQAPGSAIYFAIDTPYENTLIASYFAAIKSVFNNPSVNTKGYTVGVYGSGYACQTALSAGASYTWLNAASYAWTNTGSYNNGNAAQVASLAQVAVDEHPPKSGTVPYTNLDPTGQQYKQIIIGNAVLGVDINVAQQGSDFGAFGAGSSPPPPGVTFTVSPASAVEGDQITFTISIQNPNYTSQPGGYLIYYSTSNGTAIAGQDYTGTNGLVSLPDFTLTSPQSYTVTIDTQKNNPIAGSQYFYLNLYVSVHEHVEFIGSVVIL